MTFRAPPRFFSVRSDTRLFSPQANAPFVPCMSASACDYQPRWGTCVKGKGCVWGRRSLPPSKAAACGEEAARSSRVSGLREVTRKNARPWRRKYALNPLPCCWQGLRLILALWACHRFTAFCYCFLFLEGMFCFNALFWFNTLTHGLVRTHCKVTGLGKMV